MPDDRLQRTREAYDPRIDVLLNQKAALIAYLCSKTVAEDWHAVADAAMDLRELEAARRVLESLK